MALRASVDALRAFVELRGFPGGAGASRTAVIEVSWERGALRELVVRSASAGGGRAEEISGRLDLREPRHRALAEAILRPRVPAAADLRALARAIARDGTVERQTFAIERERAGLLGGGSPGRRARRVAHAHRQRPAAGRRRDAGFAAGHAQRRFDCLGLP